MKENMFDVLMYLFEHYYMDEETEFGPDRESLHSELVEAGFPSADIHRAFVWLEDLAEQQHQIHSPQTENAIRIFSERECERLDPECRGFLLFLEQMGILLPDARERVIERAMALETDDFDISQLKWVILMVLFNQPGAEAWPITSASYILMHKVADKPEQSAEVLKFFKWALNNGQKLAGDLDYVPLPAGVVKQIEASWAGIRDASGKPVLGN